MKRFLLSILFCLAIWANAQAGFNIIEAQAWKESAYITWTMDDNYESYRVYYSDNGVDYTAVDAHLLRRYPGYARADVPGLPAGSYRLKVVPLQDGKELNDKALTSGELQVKAHDRSGYAHFNYSKGVGAYQDNGALKSDAQVFYITPDNAKTISGTVDGIACTGFQALINARQKGKGSNPLCFRIIGCIKADDMDAFGSSAQGLQVKGKSGYKEVNITIEGIGNDACFKGFGFLIRNCESLEIRNLGLLDFMDDGISIDTDNRHCWIHHIDFFYGQKGSASDQVKGDGSLDCKGDSQYLTFAYNHFWDSGKSSMCGMKSESGENFISYHHNWFDHSDSRHPRVRTMSVHVWNNYYDGVAGYAVGATMGANVFVEANCFRDVNKPMLISLQGSDISSGGKGTFSSEAGGIIKAYGNLFSEQSSDFKFVPHSQSATQFDAYLAQTRDEQVPETYKTLSGGNVYNNFDTDNSRIYTYSPLAAEEVATYVTGYYGAGRLQHGDLQYSFSNSTDDHSTTIITALKTAVEGYSSQVLGLVGESNFKDAPTELPVVGRSKDQADDGQCFDLQGRPIGEARKGEIYLQGGRKFLQR